MRKSGQRLFRREKDCTKFSIIPGLRRFSLKKGNGIDTREMIHHEKRGDKRKAETFGKKFRRRAFLRLPKRRKPLLEKGEACGLYGVVL